MTVAAGISIALTVGLHNIARVANLPATFTFPMLVTGASLAALSMYWLAAMSLSARAGSGHSPGGEFDSPTDGRGA